MITIEQQISFISEYIEEMDDDFDGSVLWESNKKVYEAILETLQKVKTGEALQFLAQQAQELNLGY